MNRNALFVASCVMSNNAARMAVGGLAFPILQKTKSTGGIFHGGGMISNDERHRGLVRTSMALFDERPGSNDGEGDAKYDVDNDNDNDDDEVGRISPRRKQQPRAVRNFVVGEFDDGTIDWESLDMDEMDDYFFDPFDYPDGDDDDDDDEYVDIDEYDGEILREFDRETLLEILGLEDDGETITLSDLDVGGGGGGGSSSGMESFADRHVVHEYPSDRTIVDEKRTNVVSRRGYDDLEKALMRGVVPAEAGVGSGILPGDCGFDPLEFSTRDYFKRIQKFILNLLPERRGDVADDDNYDETSPPGRGDDGSAMPAATAGFANDEERPSALILRDYREAEIRHGRLAMLAAAIWPLQEILDRIFIPDTFGSMTIVYGGGPTLPFLPLIMMFAMLNLGYLDIYSSEIKENESGDAFLPGECFWDPLCILEGAPDTMKRNMQEREILNGRAAMIAVAAYAFEEAMTHVPIVGLPTNALLFEPAYQVPFIQQWLDMQFGNIDYSVYIDPGL